jgi:hypothetical protein
LAIARALDAASCCLAPDIIVLRWCWLLCCLTVNRKMVSIKVLLLLLLLLCLTCIVSCHLLYCHYVMPMNCQELRAKQGDLAAGHEAAQVGELIPVMPAEGTSSKAAPAVALLMYAAVATLACQQPQLSLSLPLSLSLFLCVKHGWWLMD